MIITLNTNITQEDAVKRLDALLNLANQINGKFDNDGAILSWDQELEKEIKALFKDAVSIIAELNLKGRYDNYLGIELTKIATPNNYDEKRKERNENNKIIFLYQLNQLIKLKSDIPSCNPQNKSNNKIEIFISNDYGIYKNQKTKKPSYPIRESKRLQLIKLLENNKSSSKIIMRDLKYTNQLLSKEIKEINNNFTKLLNLSNDLIIHLPTGGYQLNYDKYNINFIKTHT